MKTIITLFFVGTFFMFLPSCSPRLVEPEVEMIIDGRGTNRPITKSGLVMTSNPLEILHKAQTNHVAILIHAISFMDSVYVQTLGPDALMELNITEEEYEYAQEYLTALNNALKNK